MDASYVLAAGSAMLQMGLFCVIGSLFGRFPRPEGLLSQASLKTLSSCVYWLFTPALLLTTFGAKLTPETLASAATCFAWSLIHALVNFVVGAKIMGCVFTVDPELVAAYELAVTYNNGASVPLLVFAGLTRSTPQLRGDAGAYDRAVALIFAYVLLWNFTFWSLGVAHIERNAARLHALRSAASSQASKADSAVTDLESTHVVVDESPPKSSRPPLAGQGESVGVGYDARPLGGSDSVGSIAASSEVPALTSAAAAQSTLFAPAAGQVRSGGTVTPLSRRQHWEAAAAAATGIAWRAFRKAVITPPVLGIVGGVIIGLSAPLRGLLFVPGGALQPIGDVLALVGQPSVPCSNLILGGSLYHGLADLWRIVKAYRLKKALGGRARPRHPAPRVSPPTTAPSRNTAAVMRPSASTASLAEVADEDDNGDAEHAAATPLHTPRVSQQPPLRITAPLSSSTLIPVIAKPSSQRSDDTAPPAEAPSPALRARQGSVIGGSGQPQRGRGSSAAAPVMRAATPSASTEGAFDESAAWATGVDAALEVSAFDHLTRVTMAVAAVPMMPVDAQMHCDDRDDIIIQSSEILRAASIRVRTGRAPSGVPATPAVAAIAPRARAASSRSARAGSSGGPASGELELSSAIIRAASRRGVRASSFQVVAPSSTAAQRSSDGQKSGAAELLDQHEADSRVADVADADGESPRGNEGDDPQAEGEAVDVQATLRLGALLLAARLVVCPALLFGLFAACVAGAVPVLAPAPGDSVLALLVLVEACAPSAQSVLLLCQMTGQARAAKSLSIVFLVMYPASLITMTVWISVAMAMVFG